MAGRLTHGTRVALLVGLIAGLGTLAGIGAMVVARETDRVLSSIADEDMPRLVAASELEIALLRQRGLVSAFILDGGHTAWLNDLDKTRPGLAFWMGEVRKGAHVESERLTIGLLENVYADFDRRRNEAIALVESGRVAEGRRILLTDVSVLSNEAGALCHAIVASVRDTMATKVAASHARVERWTIVVAICVAGALLAALTLGVLLARQLFRPIRRLARDTRAATGGDAAASALAPRDALGQLEFYSRALMSDVQRSRVRLEESDHRLARAEKLAAVGRFAAMATHEIRNPLTAMRIWLHELRDADNPAIRAEQCDRLAAEVERLEELATGFLRYSRPPDTRFEQVCMRKVVQRTLSLLERHPGAGRLRYVPSAEVPPAIRADPRQLQQALLNLVLNAVEAAPAETGIEVAEAIERSTEGARELVVRVADSGPGVPDSVRERLGEPFLTTKPHGTGLGLATVMDILAIHGGRLVLEASGPQGCTFAMRLPAGGD